MMRGFKNAYMNAYTCYKHANFSIKLIILQFNLSCVHNGCSLRNLTLKISYFEFYNRFIITNKIYLDKFIIQEFQE